jgi:hypothetical protein
MIDQPNRDPDQYSTYQPLKGEVELSNLNDYLIQKLQNDLF